jgi:WD40 repeat protein
MKKNYNHAPVILYASLITVSAVYSGGVDTVTVPIRKYSMGLIKYTTSSNDGKRIFIRGGDGTLRLYDFSSGIVFWH